MKAALAFAHTVWGAALLALAMWVAVAAIRILPYMSTGTVLTNLPVAIALAIGESTPIAALGLWIISLGRAVRRGDADARIRILRAHSVQFCCGLGLVWLGVADLKAAAASAARGGGLLGGIGLIPCVFGGGLALFSACAIVVAYRTLGQSLG